MTTQRLNYKYIMNQALTKTRIAFKMTVISGIGKKELFAFMINDQPAN